MFLIKWQSQQSGIKKTKKQVQLSNISNKPRIDEQSTIVY